MNKIKKIALLLLIAVQLFSFGIVKAAGQSTENEALKTQTQALGDASGLNVNGSIAGILSVGLKVILGFLGIIFLFLTLQAGFKWMTSQGNEDEIKKAKGSLTNAIIGLLIVIGAYAITVAVFRYLPFATGGGGVIKTS